MIEINEKDFIGEGGFQKCYVHPEDEKLCIKIATKDLNNTRLGQEISYTSKVSRRKFKNLKHLFFSKYYKKISTNLGDGFVYDLIRDEDTGNISKTMADYLIDENSKLSDNTLNQGFKELVKLMIKHKIVAKDFYPNNICCKILKDQSIQMVIIDGLGHADLIPITEWFSFFTKKKLNRRIQRNKLYDLNKQRQFLKEKKW